MWWFPFLDPHLCNFLPWPTSVWRIHWGGDEELSDLECFIRIRTISFVIWFLLCSLDKWIGKVWKEGILKWIFLYSKWGNFLVILKGLPACSKKLLLSQSSPFFVPFPIQRFQATNSCPKATLRWAVKILHVLQQWSWRKMTNHNFMTTLWTIKCECGAVEHQPA